MTSEGLYEVIGRRRDVRAEFTGAPIDPQVLDRMLGAAQTRTKRGDEPAVGLRAHPRPTDQGRLPHPMS